MNNISNISKGNEQFEREIELARKLYKNKHPLFGFKHGLSVMNNASRICDQIKKNPDMTVTLIASLFHDVGFYGEKALEEHALRTRGILEPHFKNFAYSEDIKEKIILATTRHSRFTWPKYGHPQSLEEKIVFDADQLEWLNIRGVLKYYEIARPKNLSDEEFPFEEFYRKLPNDLTQRYKNLFLIESKLLIKNHYHNVMKILK